MHLRASQINGCSAYVNAGAMSAAKAGVSPEKLLTLADRPGAVTDEIWAEAARHYSERQLEALVVIVAMTNFFNRINTTLRVPAGTQRD